MAITQETTIDRTIEYVTQQHIGMWVHELSTTAENVTRGEKLSEN